MKTFFLIAVAVSLLQGAYMRDATLNVVYDDQTDLTWEDGKNHIYTWEGAIGYCESLDFAGVQDWRLPNINEVLSMVDYSAQNTVINPTFNFLAPEPYWSATTDAQDTTTAWYVTFSDGYSRSYPKSFERYIRCVRQGKISGSVNSDVSTLPALFYLLQ